MSPTTIETYLTACGIPADDGAKIQSINSIDTLCEKFQETKINEQTSRENGICVLLFIFRTVLVAATLSILWIGILINKRD